jgi:glucose-6-phosphate isomerase
MKFNFDKHSLVPARDIVMQVSELKAYEKLINTVAHSRKYNFPESFVKLPFDESLITKVLKLKQKLMNQNIKYIVVVGIGGSNLGAKAVYDAVLGYADVIEPNRFPKMIFVDTLQPAFTKKVGRLIEKNEALLVLISKNGTTVESLANFQILLGIAPATRKNVIVISNELSTFIEKANKKGFSTLAIPQLVGGRYSVFSAVGLFPLACIGIDIVSLCEGGMKALADIEGGEIAASIITAHYRNGKDIYVNFLFDPRLETLGKWHRQLLAESLGKKDYCGSSHGITPEISIGTTDMHSMLQLYLSGKNNRQFNFVKNNVGSGNIISKRTNITDKELINNIYEKAKNEFKEKKLPFIETELGGLNEKELGYYMQFKMLETIFIARLLKINAFDQPDVDAFKKRAPIKTPF